MLRLRALQSLSSLILLALAVLPVVHCARYRYLSYGGINRRLRHLAAENPDKLKLLYAASYLGVPPAGRCRSSPLTRAKGRPDTPCETLIADIGPADAPAVLVLGSLHGDERLGAIAAYALIEALVLRHNDEWVSRLARSRRVIVVPMPNPSAYDTFSRYEPGPNGTLLDAASDFPFARVAPHPPGSRTSCLRSTSARTVHSLFTRHLFRIVVALHARSEFIGYSWGSDAPEFCVRAIRNASQSGAVGTPAPASTAHSTILTAHSTVRTTAEELDYDDNDAYNDCLRGWSAPDNAMLSDIARKMSHFAGASEGTAPYRVGALNDPTVAGPMPGGFVDYAYASSWRRDLIAPCGGAETAITNVSHRAAAFVFETSRAATPPERTLGSERGLYRLRSRGVVPRVLRALLLSVDLAQPYAFFTAARRPRVGRGGVLRAQWSVGGAVSVDRTYLRVTIGSSVDGTTPKTVTSSNQTGSSMWGQDFDDPSGSTSLFARIQRRRRVDRFVYDDAVPLYSYLTPYQREHGTRLFVQAVAYVDSAWGDVPSNASGAHMAPDGLGNVTGFDGRAQSHLARSRTDRDYSARHAGNSISYEGVVVSDAVELPVPPLSGWLVWRDLALVSILLCIVPPAVLMTCLRRTGKIAAVGPTSRSLARLRLRQFRRAQGWFRNSTRRDIAADLAEIQRLRTRPNEAP